MKQEQARRIAREVFSGAGEKELSRIIERQTQYPYRWDYADDDTIEELFRKEIQDYKDSQE